MSLPDIMNIKQTAEYLQISERKIRQMLKDEEIPACKIGNQWRLSKDLLIKWIESNSVKYEIPTYKVDGYFPSRI